jgi:hypothetical protein
MTRQGLVQAALNAALTSGFTSCTSAQMPMGNPTYQHGETHGTMAMIVAAITKL